MHLDQTKNHIGRLEKIFEALDESPKGESCDGMEGLLEEGSQVMEEDIEPDALDAGLISAAQRVEHYEIGLTAHCARGPTFLATSKPFPCCKRLGTRKRKPVRSSRRCQKRLTSRPWLPAVASGPLLRLSFRGIPLVLAVPQGQVRTSESPRFASRVFPGQARQVRSGVVPAARAILAVRSRLSFPL